MVEVVCVLISNSRSRRKKGQLGRGVVGVNRFQYFDRGTTERSVSFLLASAKQSGARRAKRAVVEAAGRQRSEGGRGRSEVLFIPTNAGN